MHLSKGIVASVLFSLALILATSDFVAGQAHAQGAVAAAACPVAVGRYTGRLICPAAPCGAKAGATCGKVDVLRWNGTKWVKTGRKTCGC